MRKSLAVLAAAGMLTVLGGCGTSGGEDDAADDPTTTEASETTEAAEEETTTTEAPADDAVAVEEWAVSFCDDFSTWLTDIQDASSSVGTEIAPGDFDGAKAAIAGLFGTASDITDQLISDLEENGAPDIEDGDQLVADLIEKFEGFVAAVDQAEADTEALEADPATFEADITALTDRFSAEVEAVGDSFSEIDADYPSPELTAAINESCAF
jgi:hypothetical protein